MLQIIEAVSKSHIEKVRELEARKRRYKSMRLDTLPVMDKAISIYKSLKFEEIDAYTKEPIADARYMELKL